MVNVSSSIHHPPVANLVHHVNPIRFCSGSSFCGRNCNSKDQREKLFDFATGINCLQTRRPGLIYLTGFRLDLSAQTMIGSAPLQYFANCIRTVIRSSDTQIKRSDTHEGYRVLLWSIGESNPVSLHSVSFATVVRGSLPLCPDSFAQQASGSLSPAANASLGHRLPPPLYNASHCI